MNFFERCFFALWITGLLYFADIDSCNACEWSAEMEAQFQESIEAECRSGVILCVD